MPPGSLSRHLQRRSRSLTTIPVTVIAAAGPAVQDRGLGSCPSGSSLACSSTWPEIDRVCRIQCLPRARRILPRKSTHVRFLSRHRNVESKASLSLWRREAKAEGLIASTSPKLMESDDCLVATTDACVSVRGSVKVGSSCYLGRCMWLSDCLSERSTCIEVVSWRFLSRRGNCSGLVASQRDYRCTKYSLSRLHGTARELGGLDLGQAGQGPEGT